MVINERKIENSEFPQIKNRFINLINDGKEFGDKLIKDKKDKNKTISTVLNSPYALATDAKAREQITESVLKDNMKEFVQQIFRHYDVNPSIEETTKKIRETYVTKNLDVIDYLKKHLHTVNEDDSLYHEVIGLFNKIREGYDIHQEDRKIYITGIRGAGKTSYLNYFISKHESELNNQKIISIRINVLRIHSNVSIANAIKFKICRILFTYYCTFQSQAHERIKNRHIKDNMNSYLLDIIKDGSNIFRENDINECSDYFKRYNSKEPTQLGPNYIELCELLLHRIEKDYNFIIMLDNFDQVTTNNKRTYEKRKTELRAITTSPFFNLSIFIIAVRYSTFNTLDNISRTKKRCRVIGTPSTFDMITKRVNYFANIPGAQSAEMKITFLKNLIIMIGNNFMPASSNKKSNSIDFQQACNLFDEIFYGDKRIILNMLHRFIAIIPQDDFNLLLEHDYNNIIDKLFDKLISHTYYKFFESLLIDIDNGYCNSFFEYKNEQGNYKFSRINGTAFFDEIFFPNIYRFAAIPYVKDCQFIPFLKIRILQLLRNYEKDNYDKLSQNLLARKLKEIFDYRSDLIHLACEELRWDQSIIIIEKEPESEDDNVEELRNKPLDITPRGKKLLDILPTNINVLAVSLEQIFLPIEFVVNGGIPIGNYNDKNISKFIIRNIFYSLPKTIGLLKSMEKYEKNVLLTRTKDENKKLFDLNSDFSITMKLEEIASNSIERIYFSYFDNYNENDTKYIKRRNELKEQLEI